MRRVTANGHRRPRTWLTTEVLYIHPERRPCISWSKLEDGRFSISLPEILEIAAVVFFTGHPLVTDNDGLTQAAGAFLERDSQGCPPPSLTSWAA